MFVVLRDVKLLGRKLSCNIKIPPQSHCMSYIHETVTTSNQVSAMHSRMNLSFTTILSLVFMTSDHKARVYFNVRSKATIFSFVALHVTFRIFKVWRLKKSWSSLQNGHMCSFAHHNYFHRQHVWVNCWHKIWLNASISSLRWTFG